MVKRNLLTKTTTLGVVSVLALIIGLASSKGILPKAQAEGGIPERSGPHECSLGTLQGTYLFTSTEAVPQFRLDPDRPFAAAGVRTFDGAGNIDVLATASRNGVISPQGHSPGAYTLEPDCTGTMLTHVTPERDVHWNIYVARDGSEGVAVRSDDGTIGILTFKRQ